MTVIPGDPKDLEGGGHALYISHTVPFLCFALCGFPKYLLIKNLNMLVNNWPRQGPVFQSWLHASYCPISCPGAA